MLLSSQCFSKDICKLIDSPYMRSFNCPSRDVMLNKITINFKVLSSFVIHLVHCNMYCNFVVTVKSRTFSLLLPKFPKQAPNPNSLGNSSSEEMRESPCHTQNPLIDLIIILQRVEMLRTNSQQNPRREVLKINPIR